MQVAPPDDQIGIKCKWRHLMTKLGSNASGATWRLHFVTCASGSFWWPSFKISNKFQDFNQISGFRPNFRISTKCQDFDQISGFRPNFRILTKFPGFGPNFRISTKFQDFIQISGFQPNFRNLTKFQNFKQISGF